MANIECLATALRARKAMRRGRSRSHRLRGVVLVMTIAMIVVLIGFASLTIDVGYLYGVRLDLQNAVDAASLAGASALPLYEEDVVDRVEEMAASHIADGKPVTLERSDITLGFWDADGAVFSPANGSEGRTPDAVKVFAQLSSKRGNPVSLFFAPLLGHNQSDVSASATATYGTADPWNVVIVQDVTGSFTSEIPQARLADQALLDCIYEHTSGDSLVGIVAFTGFGATLSPLLAVGESYSSLSATIGGISNCGKMGMPSCAGTNIGAGIDEGIALLRDLDSDERNAIVIVSDGMPNSSLKGYTDQDLADWAVQSADEADALGISVFILFYGNHNTDPGALDYLSSLVRGDGTAHYTLDADEMAIALQEMCRNGLPLMLVQ